MEHKTPKRKRGPSYQRRLARRAAQRQEAAQQRSLSGIQMHESSLNEYLSLDFDIYERNTQPLNSSSNIPDLNSKSNYIDIDSHYENCADSVIYMKMAELSKEIEEKKAQKRKLDDEIDKLEKLKYQNYAKLQKNIYKR